MYAEGFVTLEYAKDPVTNKDIRTEITKVTKNYSESVVKDKASAIEYVYNAKIEQELDQIHRLVDKENGICRCAYCEKKIKLK